MTDKPTEQQIVDAATIRKLATVIGQLDKNTPNLDSVISGMTSPVMINAMRSVMEGKNKYGEIAAARETMGLEVRGMPAPVGDKDYLFPSNKAMELAKDGIQESDFKGIIKEVRENSPPLATGSGSSIPRVR